MLFCWEKLKKASKSRSLWFIVYGLFAKGCGLSGILTELLKTIFGERVGDEFAKDGKWDGRDISSADGTGLDVLDVSDGSGDDLGVIAVVLLDLHDIGDEFHGLKAGVIKTSKEW